MLLMANATPAMDRVVNAVVLLAPSVLTVPIVPCISALVLKSVPKALFLRPVLKIRNTFNFVGRVHRLVPNATVWIIAQNV